MSVQNISTKETRPYVIHVNGEPLYGIMANVSVESEAGSLTPAELQQVLFSGMHAVEIIPYVKKARDFSDKRTALLTPAEETPAKDEKAAASK